MKQAMLIPKENAPMFKGYKKQYPYHYIMHCVVCEHFFLYNTRFKRPIGEFTFIRCRDCSQFTILPEAEIP